MKLSSPTATVLLAAAALLAASDAAPSSSLGSLLVDGTAAKSTSPHVSADTLTSQTPSSRLALVSGKDKYPNEAVQWPLASRTHIKRAPPAKDDHDHDSHHSHEGHSHEGHSHEDHSHEGHSHEGHSHQPGADESNNHNDHNHALSESDASADHDHDHDHDHSRSKEAGSEAVQNETPTAAGGNSDHDHSGHDHSGHKHDHSGHKHDHSGHKHDHSGHKHDHSGHKHAPKPSPTGTALADQGDVAIIDSDRLSPGMVWLASFISILIVTVLAGLGIILVPILAARPKLNVAVMAGLIGLAVGTMAGDAILHMIPESLGLHSHGHDGHDHDHDTHSHSETDHAHDHDHSYMWTALVCVAGAFAFFLIEHVMHLFGHSHSHAHGHAHSHASHGHGAMLPSAAAQKKVEEGNHTSSAESSSSECFTPNRNGVHMKESEYDSKKVKPVAWLVMFGDAVHNTTDGLAIGISFAASWRLGVSTALAVMLHELPHELGDYAVFLASGIPRWRAAAYNMACNLSSFVGAAIGIALYQAIDEVARAYVLAFTAGGFLYIAFADLTPILFEMAYPKAEGHCADSADLTSSPTPDIQVVEQGHSHAGHAHRAPIVAQIFGFAAGVGCMVLIALYGESISI